MPVDRDLLNIFVNDGAKMSAAIFNRLPGRLSGYLKQNLAHDFGAAFNNLITVFQENIKQ